MEKTIRLALNRFKETPLTLRDSFSAESHLAQVSIPLASLYHHYYLDFHGKEPPIPDPAQFDYLRFLHSSPDFRFIGDGLGDGVSARRNSSEALGRAFCRWFLHDHLGITYFSKTEKVVKRILPTNFGKHSIEKSKSGDMPDFLCTDNEEIFLAEAKGQYPAISFTNKKFESWRKQFECVTIKDGSGNPRKVKGFIVATRFATELSERVNSQLFAEDPSTTGEGELNIEDTIWFSNLTKAGHYSEITAKMNQPLISSALANGFVVPRELQFPIMVWKFLVGPLQGEKFVGGFYLNSGNSPLRLVGNRFLLNAPDALNLDSDTGTFFGIQIEIFRDIMKLARTGFNAAVEIRKYENVIPFYSAVSILRDGSLIAPLEFLSLVGEEVF